MMQYFLITNSKTISIQPDTYLSLPDGPEAGLRLRKAFNHFVFIDDEEDDDILRSPNFGEPGSSLAKKSSFCNEIVKDEIRN